MGASATRWLPFSNDNVRSSVSVSRTETLRDPAPRDFQRRAAASPCERLSAYVINLLPRSRRVVSLLPPVKESRERRVASTNVIYTRYEERDSAIRVDAFARILYPMHEHFDSVRERGIAVT